MYNALLALNLALWPLAETDEMRSNNSVFINIGILNMVCFNHPRESSSAICKHCQKLICKSCIIDSGWGFVCSENCKNEIKEVEKMLSQNKLIASSNKLSTDVLINEFERSKKNQFSLIASLIFISFLVIAAGIDRGDYGYSVTFIAIFVIMILYSVFKIRSLKKALKQLEVTS
ncbi:B-box zinc finger protein [Vibrio fluvialis]|uniref:B-box zinc finger protein n=1 Tax=Vibrio fluvialis TaxID=676 RepID=UPI00215D3F51|nr:B-box zinc finger protein [Vibrio fluvialis]MCR9300085.1 B-box zinc finger protein [Vibrio fluvialis]